MDLPTLRYVTQAGGRLDPTRCAATPRPAGARLGLYVMYGQTEATARMAYLPPDLAAAHPDRDRHRHPRRRRSPSNPSTSTESDAAVYPASASDGAEGELVYRGPNVMLGYANSAG